MFIRGPRVGSILLSRIYSLDLNIVSLISVFFVITAGKIIFFAMNLYSSLIKSLRF